MPLQSKHQIIEAAEIMAGGEKLPDKFFEKLEVNLKALHRIGVYPWSFLDILRLMTDSGMKLTTEVPPPKPKPKEVQVPTDWSKVPKGSSVDLISGNQGKFVGIDGAMALIQVGNNPNPIKLPLDGDGFTLVK